MKYSQSNIEQLFKLIGSFPNQQYVQTDYFEYIKTKDSIWPNQLLNLQASENEIETVLDLIEEQSKDGEIPNLLMLNPNTKIHSLNDKLRQRAYKSGLWYAMAHSLNNLTPQNTNPNFKVIRVQIKDLGIWLSIVEEELMDNKPLNTVLFKNLLDNNNCYFYLGFERNLAVATSFLFVDKKNAGVYLVSTKKTHRRKGFGREMTNHCLLMAKVLRCENVELQATEIGKGVYESVGFTIHGSVDVFRIKKHNHNPE